MLNYFKKEFLVKLSEINRGTNFKENVAIIRGWTAWECWEIAKNTCKEKQDETGTDWCIIDMKRLT